MREKELRKLRRQDLLELLLEQEKEIARLEKLLNETNEKLQERNLVMEQAGSIAEAALRLNGVFETAQKAADQYLESVRALAGQSEDGGNDEKNDGL